MKLSKPTAIEWPVTWKEPISGGQYAKAKVTFLIERPTAADWRDFQNRTADVTNDTYSSPPLTHRSALERRDAEAIDWLMDYVKGWTDVTDENEELAPFNAENFAKLLNIYPALYRLIPQTLAELSAGGLEKN